MMKRIDVAAAVIRKNGRTFICSRPKNSPLGDFFEFPGGKCEPGETPENCIIREIREELGIRVIPLDRIHTLEHQYPDKFVRVFFIRCVVTDDSPPPRPLNQQEIRWVDTAGLAQVNFLPADPPLAKMMADSFQIAKNG
ncbi:MAG: (deoxy)nucleoside triphosphate pyrophosphohydrolase [Lentisphaeria bacterium]|nr:(deoxy)nucleoside triphosphate pyrophosphohydrolase [Lentisphaeria bacterium]